MGERCRHMRVYLSLFIATFRSTVAYKSAVFAGMFATVVSIGILVSLWSRVLVETGRGSIKDFDLPAVTTYFVCGNLFALLLQNEVDTRVAGEIYRGDHICALVRPIDYRRGHLVLGMAVIASRALVLALPLLLVAAVVLPMTSPLPGDLLLGLVSLILALAIALNANLLLGLVGFATSNTWGVRYIYGSLLTALSGQVVPLSLLPSLIRRLLECLPFAAMISMPMQVLQHRYASRSHLLIILSVQLTWVVVLNLIGRFAWKRLHTQAQAVGG